MQNYPQRKWARLKGYDYASEGYYFITICTKDRKCLLARIDTSSDGETKVFLTEFGCVAESYLLSLSGIEKYVIMPNHIHMIIHKTNGKPISSDIRSFKGLVTKTIGESIWQKYYYDHVIRDENDYLIKWNYIDSNPGKWAEDDYHPSRIISNSP